MENKRSRQPEPGAFDGIVVTDEAGVVSSAERTRLREAMLANLRVAEYRQSRRDDYIEAERRVSVNIREQRVRAGLSQEQVANDMKMCGFDLHQSTVAKIETGKRPLRIAEMFALADVLSVPWTSLLEGGRDVDVFPGEGMLPVDVWEAGLEELLYKREDVMSDIVQTIETKAREYADWDRRILIRIAALANAAAEARQQGTLKDEERVDELVQKWLAEASTWKRYRDEADTPAHRAKVEEIRRHADENHEAAMKLVDEFLEWRDGASS